MLDVAVVGAGAAGLATAIFAARRMPDRRIAALDGAVKLGAKILVAGGGRCNVTNAVVTERDYWGGSSNVVRQVLRQLTVAQTVAFFAELGVALHEEEHGKLFPDSNSARTVVAALLAEAGRRRVELRTGQRVHGLRRAGEGFELDTPGGVCRARAVVLATGGLSLPRTGSDGGGYELARGLGHSLVATTAALDPLELSGDFHVPLSGVSHEAELCVQAAGGKPVRLRGSLLWTHFGVSGPVALNASRHWNRARLEGRAVRVTANLLGGVDFACVEQRLIDLAAEQPRVHLRNALAQWLPARLAEALLQRTQVAGDQPLAHLARADRRVLGHALVELELPVTGTRGYKYAEVTAGGVPLTEIDPRTMESRVCPGLFLVGEILDVDGRIGGFNFQWAWASGFVAAGGLAAMLA